MHIIPMVIIPRSDPRYGLSYVFIAVISAFGSVSYGANIAVFLSFTLAAGYFFGKTFSSVGILHAKDAIVACFVK